MKNYSSLKQKDIILFSLKKKKKVQEYLNIKKKKVIALKVCIKNMQGNKEI